MSKIKVLDENIINQIAAGEVIENPASVVKELVENSLDAGAKRITISVVKGGLEEIVVRDNGEGMSREDALLAFKRHATSKISSFSDLLSLRTLGFRGEALPSIASISTMVVTTREPRAIKGHRLNIEKGEVLSVKPVGAAPGTTIKVENLFKNVPARLKYLRDPGHEFREIRSIIERLALSRSDVSFELIHNQKTIFTTPGTSNLRDTILAIYGKDMAREMVRVEPKEYNYVTISGFIGKPQLTRKSRRFQSFYVNERTVFNPELNMALKRAYDQLIARGRFPVGVLFIEINPVHIDVNIHPTKRLVKFSREQIVTDAVTRAVQETLQGIDKIPEIKIRSGATDAFGDRGTDYFQKASNSHDNKTFQKEKLPFSQIDKRQGEVNTKGEIDGKPLFYHDDNPVGFFDSNNQKRSTAYPSEVTGDSTVCEDGPPDRETFSGLPVIIGQFLNCYILVQINDELWLVDQHTAHERINYERIIKEYQNSKSIPCQELLIPLNIQLSPGEMDIIEENRNILVQLGFIFEEFGARNILIRSYPQLEGLSGKELFYDIIDLLTVGKRQFAVSDFIDEVITLISCHGAIKAGKKLTGSEMEALINEWMRCDAPWRCPHGRPVVYKVNKSTLDRYFGR